VLSKPESIRRVRISAADLALDLRVLADLLEAGLSASRALAALERLATPSLRSALPAIKASIRQGHSLASALDTESISIPPIVVSVIHAGEGGGGLAAAVRQAGEIMEESAALRAALIAALAYPVLLCASGAASVAVLTLIVLPRFAAILGDMGQALPRTTVLVLSAAGIARVAALPGIVAAILAFIVWHVWTSTDEGRRRWHELLLSTPLLGQARFAAATGRGCGALSALLNNGLPLGAALPLAGRATGDAALMPRFTQARQLLARGASLGAAFADTTAVSETAIRLTRAGEESGRLASMLGHAGRLERDRAGRITRGAVRVLEPLLIVLFGGVVAIVAGALLQAVYSVRPVA
jgi:general secretion pathway protein F